MYVALAAGQDELTDLLTTAGVRGAVGRPGPRGWNLARLPDDLSEDDLERLVADRWPTHLVVRAAATGLDVHLRRPDATIRWSTVQGSGDDLDRLLEAVVEEIVEPTTAAEAATTLRWALLMSGPTEAELVTTAWRPLGLPDPGPEDDRAVVAFHGERGRARMLGSLLGPTVLAPEEDGWHLLVPIGEVKARAAVLAEALASGPFGRSGDRVVVLTRCGPERSIATPLEADGKVRRWDPLWRVTGDDPEEVESRTPEQVLAELGVPRRALALLELSERELPEQGEGLARSGATATAEDYVRELSRVDPSRLPPPGHGARRRGVLDTAFGVIWTLLGTVLALLGLVTVAVGARPTGGTLIGDDPWVWVVLGLALAAPGILRWARRTPRSLR